MCTRRSLLIVFCCFNFGNLDQLNLILKKKKEFLREVQSKVGREVDTAPQHRALHMCPTHPCRLTPDSRTGAEVLRDV